MIRVVILVSVIAACSSTKSITNEPSQTSSQSAATMKPNPKEAMQKIDAPPAPKLTVVDHAISPKADALGWLTQAQTNSVEFKVPIEVAFSFQGVTACAIGVGVDRFDVKVDDSRLGMSLAMRAGEFCEGSKTCAMWVWANWQDGTLVVNKVDSPIAAEDRATATHFHVAK
jgi:hypothetical protein